jgi:hypothetical protein
MTLVEWITKSYHISEFKAYKSTVSVEITDSSLELVGSDQDPTGSGYGSGSENFEFTGSESGFVPGR